MAETKSVCSSLRSNPWLWALRVAQLLISVAVLALAAVNAQDYTRAGCTVPTRLQYSIAAGAIGVLFALYFLLTTGPLARHIKGWHIYVQLALDVTLVGIWAAAVAVAVTDCSSACSSCSGPGGPGSSAKGGPFGLQTGGRMCNCAGSGAGGGGAPVARRALATLAEHAEPLARRALRALVLRQNDNSDNDNDTSAPAPAPAPPPPAIESPGTQQARLGLSAAMLGMAFGGVVGDVVHQVLGGGGGKPPMPKMPQLRKPKQEFAGNGTGADGATENA